MSIAKVSWILVWRIEEGWDCAARSESNFAKGKNSSWATVASREVGSSCTLPPERTQPQKLSTANFSSGTLKTLINRLLRLKNKIFWRDPCEKKPFFSRLKSDSQKYILKGSYWPEIFAPGLKLIFTTTSLLLSFGTIVTKLATHLGVKKGGKLFSLAALSRSEWLRFFRYPVSQVIEAIQLWYKRY